MVYGGQVYPLYTGDRIDVDDPTFDKYECNEFVAAGAAIPYAARRAGVTALPADAPRSGHLQPNDWHLESNRFGHYLVFDADELTAERVVAVLDRSVLGVRRWDASHRAANDGRFYDWFVRLVFDGGREQCLNQLRSLLSGTSSDSTAQVSADLSLPPEIRSSVVDALQKALVAARENTELKAVVDDVNAQLQQANEENAALRLHLRQANLDLERTLKMHAQQVEALERAERTRRARDRQTLKELRETHEAEVAKLHDHSTKTSESLAANSSAEVAVLEERLTALTKEREQLEAEWFAADNRAQATARELASKIAELAQHASEIESLQVRLQQAEIQLTEVRHEERERRTATRAAGANRVRPDLDRFLKKLLSRTTVDEESIEELFKFESLGRALHWMMLIDRQDEQLRSKAKSVEGYRGWWEVAKVHTGARGRSDRGRLYYRTHADGVETIVHLKKDDDEQRRFLRRRLTD